MLMLLLLFFADLTLAAELGKTLLERNKELESQLTDYQRAYAEQTQEITVSQQPLRLLDAYSAHKIYLSRLRVCVRHAVSVANEAGGSATSRQRFTHAHL